MRINCYLKNVSGSVLAAWDLPVSKTSESGCMYFVVYLANTFKHALTCCSEPESKEASLG